MASIFRQPISHRRTRVSVRTGFRGRGQSFEIKYGPGRLHATKEAAQSAGKAWLDNELIWQGF